MSHFSLLKPIILPTFCSEEKQYTLSYNKTYFGRDAKVFTGSEKKLHLSSANSILISYQSNYTKLRIVSYSCAKRKIGHSVYALCKEREDFERAQQRFAEKKRQEIISRPYQAFIKAFNSLLEKRSEMLAAYEEIKNLLFNEEEWATKIQQAYDVFREKTATLQSFCDTPTVENFDSTYERLNSEVTNFMNQTIFTII